MTHSLRATLIALALVSTPLSAFAQDFLPGEYRLVGTDDAGTQIRVKLKIERSGAELRVRRRAESQSGQRWEWDARATPLDARQLRVTFQDSASPGISGALRGSTQASNVFQATYVLGSDGRLLQEQVRNTTQLAPEAGWSLVDTQGTRHLKGLSYGELAQATIPPLLDAVASELQSFGPTTQPHEAKGLRKRIGKLRLHLDLFSFAYPRAGSWDPFLEIRESLDEGYETMGSFKDLYDEQGVSDPSQAVYDTQEVLDRLQPVLDWQAEFAHAGQLALVRHYLGSPSKRRLHSRKSKDLSPYFWGIGVEPRDDRHGVENLALLQRALLESARDELKDVTKIKDDELIDHDEQEAFHDFRKALRSTVKISEIFPEVFSDDASAEVLFVDEIVDRYGDINDKLVGQALAEKRGHDVRALRLADEIEDDWDELKKWQRSEDVDDKLRDLRRLVRH